MGDTIEELKRIIIAADELTLDQCLNLVSKIGRRVHAVKIHNLVDLHGPGVVNQIRKAGAARVWMDGKLHDIPNTVRLRVRAIRESGAEIITVHASGGVDMMWVAKSEVEGYKTEIFAVTALTSLNEEDVHLLHGQPSKAAVLYLARLAKLAGVHGIVCSPKEVVMLKTRQELYGLKFIVPGVRSAGKATGDQQRFDTPTAAIEAGATHIVIGRQVTTASDPVAALEELEAEVKEADRAYY